MFLQKLPSEIGKMTPYQLSQIISRLGKKFSWEVALVALPVSGKFDNDVFPLTPDLGRRVKRGEQIDRNEGKNIDDFLGEFVNG